MSVMLVLMTGMLIVLILVYGSEIAVQHCCQASPLATWSAA